eukprot:TRINITY_DN10501_c0_g1_i1.p1 TRINITY_DN10501_c0_g1~~TRINITY_DN10501_c0_g1_i1.p1  ORF type:complete len:289 (-),score=57.03 TRINITY_DN10501_c0_g1_i1:410-1276(-)
MTVFPHLHFGVMRQGKVICPFLGEEASAQEQCGVQGHPLWTSETGTRLAYIPAGLLQAGFFASQPTLPEVLRIPPVPALSSYSRVLIYAVTAFGVRAGDLIRMRIYAPSGELFVQNSMPVARNQAQRMVLIGKKTRRQACLAHRRLPGPVPAPSQRQSHRGSPAHRGGALGRCLRRPKAEGLCPQPLLDLRPAGYAVSPPFPSRNVRAMPESLEKIMILYLVIAAAVFIYYSKSRDMAPGQRIGLALLWPLTFFMYLFNTVTGRPGNNLFANSGRRQGGRGKGRGRRR